MTRFESLVQYLIPFYWPDKGWKSSHMAGTLAIARNIIVYQDTDQTYLEQAIAGAMLHLWGQFRHRTGYRNAKGTRKNAILSAEQYGRYFYRVIFLEMAGGVRSTLNRQPWFESVAGSCAFVYANWIHNRSEVPSLPPQLGPASGDISLLERLVNLQRPWIITNRLTYEDLIAPLALMKRQLMQDDSNLAECKEHSIVALLAYWHAKQLDGTAYGSEQETEVYLREFVNLWYEAYFQRLQNDRANLSHDFSVFADGYVFVLLKQVYEGKVAPVDSPQEEDNSALEDANNP